MPRTSRPLLLAAALAALSAAGPAHAGFVDWSYNWSNAPFGVQPNGGGQSGGVDIQLPPGGTASPVAPVKLTTFTALQNGDDLYHDVGYSLTFSVTDNPSGQSHPLTVSGLLNGEVTSDQASLSNTFTGGSGSQGFDFLGRHYGVTFGFAASDAPPLDWAGALTASVVVTDLGDGGNSTPPPPARAPEPATAVLATLALPAVALAARRLRS